jgi:exo-poly-alpha-galacturonosidase
MKKYLQFFVIICLLTVSSLQAQTTDVWDFGAAQLDVNTYNNLLNETVINSWYPGSVTPGSTGISFPTSFTSGALSWVGNSGDRLRTTNTNLSRYDANVASVANYTGRVYCNGTPNLSSGVPTNRFMRITLNEDDEITIICRVDTAGSMTFVNENNTSLQNDILPVTAAAGATSQLKFVAKNAGSFKLYVADGKVSIFRILKKPAIYTTVSGSIDVSQAPGLPNNYAVIFTNAAGKFWTSIMNSNGTYNLNLPIGYSYEMSLVNANGFVIFNGTTLDLTSVITPNFTHDITISQVTLYELTGAITGLGTIISNLSLSYVANPGSNTIYVPTPIINTTNATFTVQLEANVPYTIVANGVNDYELDSNAITIPTSNSTSNIDFTLKPVYNISINTLGLTSTQESNLQLKFTNLNENGYVYNFASISGITLRNGTYTVSANGLDNYPVQLALTSNLGVYGANASKTLTFIPVKVWSFEDKVITSATPAYKGMLFTGNISNAISQGHLIAQSGATLKVPVNVGDKIAINYYFAANFSIEGGAAITTINSTGSTSLTETVEYTYTGTVAGFINITIAATTYFAEIKIGGSIPYSPIITVGADKEYQTINAALEAISNMIRTSTNRVVVMIDPGNYEEMLTINQPLVTLKNASTNPSTALLNAGVDIDVNAVRVTSYYGHGYTYFSMASDQKWHQDVLNVNIQNGYASYQNAGGGTTNNSYWNATVVVGANGFEAEGIIFENSFNQYISNKESQDTVIAWTTGSPGVRPISLGNTTVQNKTFVERAAAIAIKNNVQKVILNKCRVVGRQDAFFGGTGARIAVYKGEMMGAVDYIFGGMDAVFYKSKLSMNISDASNDASYITAAQQSSGRGFLMYECTITSAQPGVETASTYRAKPGYFGRPWLATTSEVVFFNTTIETSNAPSYLNQSLIQPLGWLNTLSGTSSGMYEYGTTEISGTNNGPSRATWATSLSNPILNDSTPITTLNFTQGTDGWDPFPSLIANDVLETNHFDAKSNVNVIAYKNNVVVSNVKTNTNVHVYSIEGRLVKSFDINSDTNFSIKNGLWIVQIKDQDGDKSFKIITN